MDTLRIEYDSLRNQYEAALDQQSSDAFVTMPNRTFWGATAIDSKTVASVDDCENMCATSDDCTGATYNSDSGLCHTRAGVGQLFAAGADGDMAVIPAKLQSVRILQLLNERMTELSRQMAAEMRKNTVAEQSVERAKQAADLETVNAKLEASRARLADTGAGSALLASEYGEDMIRTDQTRAWMMIWWAFSVVFVLAIAYVTVSGRAPSRGVLVIAVTLLCGWLAVQLRGSAL